MFGRYHREGGVVQERVLLREKAIRYIDGSSPTTLLRGAWMPSLFAFHGARLQCRSVSVPLLRSHEAMFVWFDLKCVDRHMSRQPGLIWTKE